MSTSDDAKRSVTTGSVLDNDQFIAQGLAGIFLAGDIRSLERGLVLPFWDDRRVNALIAVDEQLTDEALRYRMKRGGETTGFEQVTKPYGLRYGAAKAFNDSPDVTNEVQNVMLQHAIINTFVKHCSVGIHVDAQAIVRGLPAQKQLMRFAASMSRSIDPRIPYKLDDTSCINEVPRVRALQEHVHKQELPRPARQAQKHVKACEKQSKSANQRYQRAQREFRNEWQRQRNRLVHENLERYKNEQPVIDSERQLSGKLVNEEVIGPLERTGYITPHHILLINTILTIPGSTIEKEYQRRISAINAVIAFCDVEEGSPTRRPNVSQKRRAVDAPPSTPPSKRQEPCSVVENETELQSAISTIQKI
ncbi:hypothetical protein FE257_003553 [Aspergillus nanangensis]|uniref:Uncharacterized protein n=1 Tax=Aspergillus nanangensis TaxID=2582783 RepID=A0AAD4CCP8_ASPNN|nr:hypothetical protein FE257_003553 [Aspergillus nanangensis]